MAALDTIRHSASGFFAWWTGELAGLWPKRLRLSGRRERSYLVLVVAAKEVRLLEPGADGEQELGWSPSQAPDLQTTLAAALARARRRTRNVTVRLGPDGGLRRMLELPLAARGNLDRLLQFEMDRLTPFHAEQVYVAHRIVGEDPAQKRLRADLQIAPRGTVDRALALAQELGLQAKRVELAQASETETGDEGGALNLLPDHTTERSRTPHLVRALIVLTLVLATAAVAIPLYRQQSIATNLAADVEAARVEAQKSLVLREQLDELTAAADFVVEAKRDRPMITALMAELTRALPDQAYVSQITIDDQTIQLHGLARSASGIIGHLEQSAMFRAPRFRSPVTMEAGENLERFDIEVEIQPPQEGA